MNNKILRQSKHKRGLTLIELMLAMSISIFIFELVFFVYMSLFRSWDIGFLRGQVEDEANRAIQTISKELRGASRNIVISAVNPAQVSYIKGGFKVLYLFQKDINYAEYAVGDYISSQNASLRILKAMSLNAGNYGGGRVVAKGLVSPYGTAGGTRFSIDPNGLISMQVIARGQNSRVTLNTVVYPRDRS